MLRELTNVNTKVRRLGYFPVLLKLVQERSLGRDVLLTRFATLGKENQQNLSNYANSTGDIVPSSQAKRSNSLVFRTPYSAERYVEFAREVGWLTQISGAYAITRIGRVLLNLPTTASEDENTNPFFLSLAQRLFLIHELWYKDGDILFTLIQQLETSPLPLYQIQSEFDTMYYDHLGERMQQVLTEYEYRQLLERRNNVKAWQNPSRYAEHIVPPRLHWLLDLGLVSIASSPKRECCLTTIGREFKKRFSDLDTLTDEWLETSFFKAIACCLAKESFSINVWQSTSQDQDVLISWLRTAFKRFQRSSIPKLSTSQVVLFLCICLMVKENISVDSQDVLQLLSKRIKFDFDHVIETRLSGRENESYITLNPI